MKSFAVRSDLLERSRASARQSVPAANRTRNNKKNNFLKVNSAFWIDPRVRG
jgi:hypothetical protein